MNTMAMRPLKFRKERVIKKDGRYIIFYEFEPREEDGKPDHPRAEELAKPYDSGKSEGSDKCDEGVW